MRRATFVLLAAVAAVGCGDDGGVKKYTVSGTVKYKGAPLAGGAVDFIPEAGDTSGTVSTEIRDGKYEFGSGNGVPAGKYKVSITAGFAGPPPNPSGDEKGRSPVISLPDRYNAQTVLRAEVTADGKNVFNFDDLK
jgi:hypothetical protein